MCEKCEKIKVVLKTWIDKQGHDRCWYDPDIFNDICRELQINHVEPNLPPIEEFREGCKKYQKDQYSA